jgi:predicted RNA binding protein YcfA (HicA-like mRNA interferase family)
MPSPVRFAVVRRLLEQKGYALIRIRGSHHVFEKTGKSMIVIPVHRGKVKPVYVREAEKAE